MYEEELKISKEPFSLRTKVSIIFHTTLKDLHYLFNVRKFHENTLIFITRCTQRLPVVNLMTILQTILKFQFEISF